MNRTTAAALADVSPSWLAPNPLRFGSPVAAGRFRTQVTTHVDGSRTMPSDEQPLIEHVETDAAVRVERPDPVAHAQQHHGISVVTAQRGVQAAQPAGRFGSRHALEIVGPSGAMVTSVDRCPAHAVMTADVTTDAIA
jgi:hypothetical protein